MFVKTKVAHKFICHTCGKTETFASDKVPEKAVCNNCNSRVMIEFIRTSSKK